MSKKILISAMAGSGNLGDDLIAYYLTEELTIKYPDSTIYLLVGQENINLIKFSKHVFFIRKPKLSKFKERFSVNRKLRKLFDSLDYFVIGGGGLFQDSHSEFTVHHYLKYFKFLNGKTNVIGVGLGVGPVRGQFTNNYMKEYLKYFNHIQVRDYTSKDGLSGIFQDISIAPDIVLGSKVHNILPEISKEYLGASIRPAPDLVMSQVIEELLQLYRKHKLKLFLFVFEDKSDSNVELDFNRKILKLLKEEGVQCEISNYRLDPNFLIKFSKVKYALASRYHANILWQKIGAFVKPIAYAPKVSSLYKENEIIDSFGDYVRISISTTYSLPNMDYDNNFNMSLSNQIGLYQTSVREVFALIKQKLIRNNKEYGFNIPQEKRR